ncbi:Hypothetical predicted protein [Mytilus galloprovincialis]|uniref:CARD domain-containing protein n=1 Tax=Mytilus galloprovincialis TaxID=29158 RepID=A0A8B6GJY8_MYTGA|nr:Hypothetical predicted protein [Mytilus galloprovincialis]
MDTKERFIICSNEKLLRDNIDTRGLTPHLIQNHVLSFDDAERIAKEVTNDDKAHKLLKIIKTKEKGLSALIKALRDEQMDYVAEELENTEVDESYLRKVKNEYDQQVIDILKKKFCLDDDSQQYVILQNIEEEVKFEFSMKGEKYNIAIDYLQQLVTKSFPRCTPFKKKKPKMYPLKIKPYQSNLSPTFVPPTGNEQKPTTSPQKDVTSKKSLNDLSETELVDVLKPRLVKYGIPEQILNNIVDEEITGSVFSRLKLEYMESMFPDLKKGKRVSLLYIRDDICNEEEVQVSITTEPLRLECNRSTEQETQEVEHVEANGQFRETFRKFDKEVVHTYRYQKGAILTSFNNRPSNLVDPVHRFMKGTELTSEQISDDIAEFVAACLNERTNGTIHVGVDPKMCDFQIEGELNGISVDAYKFLRILYKKMEDRYYDEQLPIVLKCMRPPQFIDLLSKEKNPNRLRVIEVDVVPKSTLVGEESFFIKSKDTGKPVLYLFAENGITPQNVSDDRCITYMSKHKKLISDTRENQEKSPMISTIKPNLRQRILDLLAAGEESLSSAVYPLLFLSPLDSSSGNDLNKFEFLIDLDPNAVFDFDYSSEDKGLYNFFDNEKEQVLKALTSDNFDPNSEENKFKKETHSNLLEDITLSVLKPWVFCNGYEAMGKMPMNIMDWKQNRSKGFKEAIRFYNNEIPEGRALVLIFLLSKDYSILLEAAEEVILSFQDQWVVFAESEEIANHFHDVLVNQRHAIGKEQLKARIVIGMPWEHVNQTIKELTGSKRSLRCEIPTSTGAFCHLRDKKRNELIDLEILSRCECEDPELIRDRVKLSQIRREEAEKFYRGENVSWWNFVFPDHVLKRDVHGSLKVKLEEALKGNRADEDNKIGLVNIYHQPGAGATTTAKHILWDLKSSYRCCIVKQITDQTVEQITVLRNYEETDDPKPPLVLIENADEEKVGELYALLQHRARIMARRSSDMKVFCVLLLCTRRTTIHSVDDTSVALKHELSPKELSWFRNRNKDLEKQFEAKEGTDPRFLVSFNILKENFNKDYIRRTASDLVEGVTNENERKMLKYLSMLNTFDLDFQSVPISAFDPIMTTRHRGVTFTFGLAGVRGKRLNKSWEQTLSQPLQVLLNSNTRAGFGGQLVGLSIVNPLFAVEIFSCFNQSPDTTSEIMKEFLECPIFKSTNMSSNEVKKIVKTIMKKREEKEETAGKVKFSPLIMNLLDKENEEIAASILIKGFEMTEDPMICQQIARLYIHCKNWKMAAKYAKIATDMKPQNSFLWDTYGQVYKNQLYDKYICFLQEGKKAFDDDIEEVIEITQNGLQKFRKEQEVSEKEHFVKGNDAGYFGEIRMIVLFLDVLRFCPLGSSKGPLHKYLTDKDFVPKDLLNLKEESVQFMKSLESRSELTLKSIEDKTTQLKDDMFYSIFGHGNPRRKEITTLKENLDSYFGEDSDVIPENLTEVEKADFRRRRVRRLGGRTLSDFIHIDNKSNLEVILLMLKDNVKSEFWVPFDIVSLFNVVITMKIVHIDQTVISYAEMVHYTRKCYDRVVSSSDRRNYLETYMHFVLLNWPTKSRLQANPNLCTTEQLHEVSRKWKAAFHANHPRQKESRPVRKRETTNFFLGVGEGLYAIVHYEELLDPWGKKFVRGDKIWESADFVKRLLRLPGTLINDGKEITCNVDTRTGGQTTHPLCLKLVSKLLQKKICQKYPVYIKWEKDKVEEYKTKLNLHKNVMTEIVENLQQVGDANSAVKSLTDIIYNCAFEVFGSSRLTHEKELIRQ